MQPFRDMSITRKLRLLLTLTNVLALLIAAIVYIAFERVATRQEMVRVLTVLADEVGLQGAASLSFRDEADAKETLTGLKADPHVLAGTIFEKDGTVFATYARDARGTLVLLQPDQDVEFLAESIRVTRPILLNGRRIGTVCVESDLELLRQRLWLLAGLVGVAILVALVLTMGFTWVLQRSISRPIDMLARTARSVSAQKDYSVRAERVTSRDEVGELTMAFNQMLDSIQEGEAALRLNSQRLEQLVKLNQMTDATPPQLAGFALEECVRLTRSEAGYLVFINETGGVDALNTWPKGGMDPDWEDAGLWHTAFVQRKPVLVNAVEPAPGLASSGADRARPVRRYMDIPLFDAERIVAVAGVRNKPANYDESDAKQTLLLLQGMWRLTQRRCAEEELIKHRDHLEELVEQRAADLKKANAQLARTAFELQCSNKELEQFAYVASHDLQEPLRKVASFTELLADRYGDKLDADARDFIRYSVDGAHRMQGLINDLLAFSRVGARGKPFAPVDCKGVFGYAIVNLEMAIKENGAVVTQENLPVVMGDERQLVQLFQNLIGNAIKFRGAEKPQVQVSAARRGAEWVFQVRDNGIGIDPQYFDQIFVIFQRLHSRGEYPGSGIGLAICKKVVERHGGDMWVKSEPGKGTSFFFSIPERAT